MKRISGVTDHYALDDEHALYLARCIVNNLNRTKNVVRGFFFPFWKEMLLSLFRVRPSPNLAKCVTETDDKSVA